VEYTEIRRHDAIDMDPHYIAPMVLQFIIWLSLARISMKRMHAATVTWLTDLHSDGSVSIQIVHVSLVSHPMIYLLMSQSPKLPRVCSAWYAA